MPRICFVNKMDRIGANFQRTVDMMIDRLGTVPLVINMPIGIEDKYEGIVDLIKMKEIVWNGEELGAKFEERQSAPNCWKPPKKPAMRCWKPPSKWTMR